MERPLSPQERDTIKWQDVEAEAPGFVVIYRYREAPHPRVTLPRIEPWGARGRQRGFIAETYIL